MFSHGQETTTCVKTPAGNWSFLFFQPDSFQLWIIFSIFKVMFEVWIVLCIYGKWINAGNEALQRCKCLNEEHLVLHQKPIQLLEQFLCVSCRLTLKYETVQFGSFTIERDGYTELYRKVEIDQIKPKTQTWVLLKHLCRERLIKGCAVSGSFCMKTINMKPVYYK